MRGLLHDFGARVVVFVDPVAKAHEADMAGLVFHPGDELGNFRWIADLGEHFERCLVGAAVGWSPQAGDAGGDAGERIGAG